MKEDNKIIVLEEGDIKKRLKELGVKLKDLGVNPEKLEITWNSFIEFLDQQAKVKIKGNYLIPYARYLESKLRHLFPRVYERIDEKEDIAHILDLERKFSSSVYELIDEKVDLNYIYALEGRFSSWINYIHNLEEISRKKELSKKKKKLEFKKIILKEGDVKKRLDHLAIKLKELGVKLKDLDVNQEKPLLIGNYLIISKNIPRYLDSITWNSFIEFIDKQTKVKIKGNYLIPYARYLESKLRPIHPRVYERIDDKVDIKYIRNLEKRFFLVRKYFPKTTRIPEKEYKINEYITLKLEDKRTQIYVNGKKFLQCMGLFLQIPPQTRHLYEELESIDEAVEVYKYPSLFQNRTITPEQEFWAHCSNLQAWVEHQYDTRLLMSNASFPLLKKLTEAGDPIARKVFKEEIAQRLESGYPSVVQYLIIQGYISHFTPFEFKTIIETTNLIKNVSAQPKMLSDFLQKCTDRFPTILGDILLKILELPEGKKILKKIVKSLNLFSMLEEHHYERDKLMKYFTPTQYMVYIYSLMKNWMARKRTMIYKLEDELKRKVIELGKIKNKGENVSDLMSQANDLIRLTRIQQKKVTSIEKDLFSRILNSMRKNRDIEAKNLEDKKAELKMAMEIFPPHNDLIKEIDKPKVIDFTRELQRLIIEQGSFLSLQFCENLIIELEKSLERPITLEDIKLAADFFVKSSIRERAFGSSHNRNKRPKRKEKLQKKQGKKNK